MTSILYRFDNPQFFLVLHYTIHIYLSLQKGKKGVRGGVAVGKENKVRICIYRVLEVFLPIFQNKYQTKQFNTYLM